jgi:hypothetical protein
LDAEGSVKQRKDEVAEYIPNTLAECGSMMHHTILVSKKEFLDNLGMRLLMQMYAAIQVNPIEQS